MIISLMQKFQNHSKFRALPDKKILARFLIMEPAEKNPE